MKIQNQTFYVVQTEELDHVYRSETEAIDHLRANADDVDPEGDSVGIVEVTYDEDDWTIKELPWQRIALELLQED